MARSFSRGQTDLLRGPWEPGTALSARSFNLCPKGWVPRHWETWEPPAPTLCYMVVGGFAITENKVALVNTHIPPKFNICGSGWAAGSCRPPEDIVIGLAYRRAGPLRGWAPFPQAANMPASSDVGFSDDGPVSLMYLFFIYIYFQMIYICKYCKYLWGAMWYFNTYIYIVYVQFILNISITSKEKLLVAIKVGQVILSSSALVALSAKRGEW